MEKNGEFIYIRPLKEADAYVSVNWRNDPDIWKFTGARPDRLISINMELEWIKKVITRQNEKRFAICTKLNDCYIGNVQLTNIEDNFAEFHIFIGDKSYWNKGVATQATKKIINYAFKTLKLKGVYLEVNKHNLFAIRAYKKNGFKEISVEGMFLKMILENRVN